MERPNYADPLAVLAAPLPRDAITTSVDRMSLTVGLKIFALAQLATIVLGAVGLVVAAGLTLAANGEPLVAAQYAITASVVMGGLAGMAIAFEQIARRCPTALRDRSMHGCAWVGAPDATVAQAFLGGGVLLVAVTLAGPDTGAAPADAPVRLADWHLLPAMAFAFATIAIAPVVEELLFRGLLFASLRQRTSTATAGIVVTVLFALMHHPQLVARPTSSFAYLALGGAALVLRLRHASLAPAIALHCGYNFTASVIAALG